MRIKQEGSHAPCLLVMRSFVLEFPRGTPFHLVRLRVNGRRQMVNLKTWLPIDETARSLYVEFNDFGHEADDSEANSSLGASLALFWRKT